MTPERFEIRFADTALTDLQDRLARTRFAPDLANEDWRYGVPTTALRHWVGAWQQFDWRAAEARLNRFEHYQITIEGQPVHFIRQWGKGRNPIPIILTHGWPWTFWDWHATIEPLADPRAHGGDSADAFDVIVPSLPGFGFSAPLTRLDLGVSGIADLWARLMSEGLGYGRFAAAGGDFGSAVSAQLGHKYADRLIGIHLLGAVPLSFKSRGGLASPPWDDDWGFAKPETPPSDPVLASLPVSPGCPPSSHRLVHALEPQTLAAALHDSPAGLMAWLLKARYFWGDKQTLAEESVLTSVSLYWLTETLWSSIRAYRASGDSPWQPSHMRTPVVEAPTGLTFFEYDATSRSRFWAADYYNLIRTSYSARGGHFSPAEVPDVVVAEIRETFRRLRS